jgi:membrane protease YdiL (CAAX protease family)
MDFNVVAWLEHPSAVDSKGLMAVRFVLIAGQVGSFLLLGWLFSRLTGLAGLQLQLSRQVIYDVLFAICAMLVALPLVYALVINPAHPWFPGALEPWFRDVQAREAEVSRLLGFILPHTPLLNLLTFALMPAFAEELFFRGFFQRTLMRDLSPRLAIILTGFVFSFIHFQFLGFFSRLMLGALFGWLSWRTASLWPAIAAHFTNNAFSVCMAYAVHGTDWETALATDQLTVPLWLTVLSTVSLASGLYLYDRYRPLKPLP